MKHTQMNDLLQTLTQLSAEERQTIARSLMATLRSADRQEQTTCDSLVREHTFKDGKPDCPHCHAQANLGYILKRGFKKNGAQRYYCKACNRFFVASTGTVFEGTHKSSDVWEKYVELTLTGVSLQTCAEECNIAYHTAFTWRHKILNAFKVHQDSTVFSGQIELDEMLIPISYKGNHIAGSFESVRKRGYGVDNNLPRKSFQRGTDNKPTSHKDRACVFCMVEDGNKAFYAAVPGVGLMQPSMLDETVGKHVDKKNAHLLADHYRTTANYLESNGYSYETLLSNTTGNERDHKPEVRDGKHLQHINAFHHHLREFLRPYCGVSTKYLENYVSLYIWLKNAAANKQKKRIKKVSISRAAGTDCYITSEAIKARPAVPCCA